MSRSRKSIMAILSLTIFYQIVLTSSWETIYTSRIWNYIGYFLYVILFLTLFFVIFKVQLPKKQMLIFLVFFSMMACYVALGNLYVATSFLIGLYIFMLGYKDVLKAYFIAILAGISVVSLLVFLKILPIQNSLGFTAFGFKNQNSFGFYLAVMYLIYIVLSWDSARFIAILVGMLLSAFMVFILQDGTALIMLISMMLFLIFKKLVKRLIELKFFRLLIYLVPTFFTVLTFWVGNNYGRNYWVTKLDEIFTSRPVIWHYYLTNYQFNLFGKDLSDITAFKGAFDGAFLYYPLVNGILVSIIILFALTRSLKILTIEQNLAVLSMFLVLLLAAFSENSPGVFYQSPLLPLAFMFATVGKSNFNIENPSLRREFNG